MPCQVLGNITRLNTLERKLGTIDIDRLPDGMAKYVQDQSDAVAEAGVVKICLNKIWKTFFDRM